MRLAEQKEGLPPNLFCFPTRAEWVKQPQPPQAVIRISYEINLTSFLLSAFRLRLFLCSLSCSSKIGSTRSTFTARFFHFFATASFNSSLFSSNVAVQAPFSWHGKSAKSDSTLTTSSYRLSSFSSWALVDKADWMA